MKVRHLQEADIDNLLALWNRNQRFDRLTPELLEEKVWEDPDFDKDLALVIEHKGQLIAFFLGVIRKTPPKGMGYIKMLVVDAAYQSNGIGRRLLQEMEQHLGHRGATAIRICESIPNYLTPGVDPRYTRAMLFFEKAGYKRFDEAINMEADLSTQEFETAAIEQKLAQQGIEIRRAIMGDHDEMMGFLKPIWPGWQPEVARAMLNYPISLHVALKENRIIAFSAYDANNFNTGTFGPMGTLEVCRGLGIGGVLLQRCLKDIREQGHRFAIIPWVEPIGFYLRYCGAEISRLFFRYEKKVVTS